MITYEINKTNNDTHLKVLPKTLRRRRKSAMHENVKHLCFTTTTKNESSLLIRKSKQ